MFWCLSEQTLEWPVELPVILDDCSKISITFSPPLIWILHAKHKTFEPLTVLSLWLLWLYWLNLPIYQINFAGKSTIFVLYKTVFNQSTVQIAIFLDTWNIFVILYILPNQHPSHVIYIPYISRCDSGYHLQTYILTLEICGNIHIYVYIKHKNMNGYTQYIVYLSLSCITFDRTVDKPVNGTI